MSDDVHVYIGESVDPALVKDFSKTLTVGMPVEGTEVLPGTKVVLHDCMVCHRKIWLTAASGAVFAERGGDVVCFPCFEAATG